MNENNMHKKRRRINRTRNITNKVEEIQKKQNNKHKLL